MISERSSSFLHFLTSVCAIVGGVFTVSGIVDAFIYQGEKIIRKKLELGKLSWFVSSAGKTHREEIAGGFVTDTVSYVNFLKNLFRLGRACSGNFFFL